MKLCKNLLSFQFIPKAFKEMAIKAEEINRLVCVAYFKLEKRVGKEKADKLINEFKNEAFATGTQNHLYMIEKMNTYETKNDN